MMMAGPQMDDAAKRARREHEKALATTVRKRLASGSWDDPDADLAVERLEEAVRGMSGFLRRALRDGFGPDGRELHADLFAGDLDGRRREQVWDLFDKRRIKRLAERALQFHGLVLKAHHALPAHPLSIYEIGGLGLCSLIRGLLRDEERFGEQFGDVHAMRELIEAWRTVNLDAEFALAVLGRARRDRRRYDAAATSEPGAYKEIPLVKPGNVEDDDHRRRYTLEFAWAIPSEEALQAIGELGPIVEVGAGSGYWAQLLRDRGTDVLAFDLQPDPFVNTEYIARQWGPVAQAPATIAGQYPDRTLLLIWPPYKSSMAREALQSYRGARLAYIGERGCGCTADDDFFEVLYEEWEEVQEVDIPQWGGWHDYLTIYRRR